MTEDQTNTDTPMDLRPSSLSDILEELVNTLRASLMPAPLPQSASASPMAMPAAYVGDSAECGGFLLQLALYIEMQLQKFTTKRSKVPFLISLLSGRALSWARAIWNANSVIIDSYEAFTNHFKEVFGSALSVSEQLLCLRQGTSSTNEYTRQFLTLAATSGRNEVAFSVLAIKDWILVSVLRWRYVTIPLNWRALCKSQSNLPVLVSLTHH